MIVRVDAAGGGLGYNETDKEDSPHPRVALATISAGTRPPATQKEQARDLLIATRDEEEDRWWRQQSDFIGLRPELTLEYHELAGRRLFLFPMSQPKSVSRGNDE